MVKCNTLGGLVAPSPIPWQVHLHLGRYTCGGTILDTETILTAAHCIDDMTEWDYLKSNYFVEAGIKDDMVKNGQKVLIKSHTIHPNYTKGKKINQHIAVKVIFHWVGWHSASLLWVGNSITRVCS